jgi:short-subunit dehydrogenase
MNIVNLIIYFIIILVIYQLLLFIYNFIKFVYRHFLVKEQDLLQRYGPNSYIIITGPSSGQGYYFARLMAERGFNLILIGSKRTNKLIDELHLIYPSIKIIFIIKDFRKAYQKNFFNDIKDKIESINGNISMLINNVAHRTAWIPYHKMPSNIINDTIIVGTIVQSQLINICLPYFINRKDRSAIINITAQCILPTFGFGEILDNEISVPFLSVYEASNAFGFYHGNSIYNEYKKYGYKIDFLNIMPGAVLTDNTMYLKNTIFNIKAEDFVENIIKLIGNVNGNSYAHYGHALSVLIINCLPFLKNNVLHNTGYTIAKHYMETPRKKY